MPFRSTNACPWLLLVAIVGAVAVVPACGDDDSRAADARVPSGTIGAEAFSAEFAARWCGLLARCCAMYGGTVLGECEAEISARAEAIRADVTSDGASFHAGRAADCLARLDTASCEGDLITVRALLAACDPWDGTVPVGGSCTRAESCEEPAPTATATCLGGTCDLVIRQGPGDPCVDGALECDDAIATCETPAGESMGTCVALPVAGEACSGACRADARCEGSTCVARGGVGDACSTGNDCASDVCHEGACIGLGEDDYCTL